MAGTTYFGRETFRFLRDLADNNDREWFAANRARYEARVRDPALRFIQDFAAELGELSGHFQAGPRALFRIHRDTRFSKDKSPYKSYTGIQFRHDRAKDVHAPGYYLHIEPGGVFAGLGIWRPDGASLRAIRERIVEKPADWKRAMRAKRFRETFNLQGDRLKRPPRGFDAEHPLIDDLRWKDFIAIRNLPQSFVTGAEFPKELAALFRSGSPFMRFLCDAVGVPF
jgi:uncharacterized protein (TIGR02453 family)